jgi:hypothetical protein
VAARAFQPDVDLVRGGRDGTGPDRDVPGRQLRIAVQREDRLDVLQTALGDHLGRARGVLLLTGLEDQPHPAGQFPVPVEFGQHTAHPGEDRRVHVVPTGVADILHFRSVRHLLGVRQRKRVQVGAQRHDPVTGADVAEHTVAGRQQGRLQARRPQLGGDQGGGAVLVAGEFRVRVNAPAKGYQLPVMLVEPGVQPSLQRRLCRRARRAGRPPITGCGLFCGDRLGGAGQRDGHGRTISINVMDVRPSKPSLTVTLCNVIQVLIRLLTVTIRWRAPRHLHLTRARPRGGQTVTNVRHSCHRRLLRTDCTATTAAPGMRRVVSLGPPARASSWEARHGP